MAEVALWQYRWTNPGDYPNTTPDMLAWKPVEHPHWQPLESKLQELRNYRANGKPCYEVRALGVIPDAALGAVQSRLRPGVQRPTIHVLREVVPERTRCPWRGLVGRD